MAEERHHHFSLYPCSERTSADSVLHTMVIERDITSIHIDVLNESSSAASEMKVCLRVLHILYTTSKETLQLLSCALYCTTTLYS